ncbi:hypothetical protein [Falsiroseomonas oryziterrae]|uniref:hypothetical protein n=1 Tax=Falsiroseomonas oryziterrae TaxID=2911368 RepID=UPI001F313C86|nr:hypothetical protein [Roseomonas sp. NPKOSM-4]
MAERGGTPVLAVVLGGLILAWPAAWNGYPLVFADTGTYLGQALLLYLGWDRPATYSVFAHALHWRLTLWTIPVVQGLVTAHLLSLVLRTLGRPGARAVLLACGLLALATGLPFLVAQVMPDLFTTLVVLALWLLGFGWERLGRWERWYVLLLATAGIAFHLSHVPLAAGLAIVAGAVTWVARGAPPALGAAGRMAAPLGVAMLALVALNAAGHGRLSLSPFGSVFMAARLIDDGPGLRTMDARCEEAGWQVCAWRAQLPMGFNHFLWEPDAPLARMGGGKAWGAEASDIVRETLAREPGAVVAETLRNAWRQFVWFGTGDGLEPWRGVPGPEPLIVRFFPGELGAFRESRQYAGLLQPEARALSPLHVALGWLGLALLPAAAWLRRRDLPALALCLMVLAASLGNALVTGGLSGVNERYQGRIAWLFPFAVAAVLASGRVPRTVRDARGATVNA